MHLVFQVFLVLHFSLKTDIWLKFLHCCWISWPHLPVGEEYFGNPNASACAFWPFSSRNLVFQVSLHFWSKNCFAIILSRFKFTYRGTKKWVTWCYRWLLAAYSLCIYKQLLSSLQLNSDINKLCVPISHETRKAMCFSRVFGWFS